jgi:hypothetical protein
MTMSGTISPANIKKELIPSMKKLSMPPSNQGKMGPRGIQGSAMPGMATINSRLNDN